MDIAKTLLSRFKLPIGPLDAMPLQSRINMALTLAQVVPNPTVQAVATAVKHVIKVQRKVKSKSAKPATLSPDIELNTVPDLDGPHG